MQGKTGLFLSSCVICAQLMRKDFAHGSAEKVDQGRDQWLIRRRHRQVTQGSGPNPAQRLAFERLGEPFPASADVERHQKVHVGVGMAGKGERRQAGLGHDDAELLGKLADQRLLRPLAGLHLPARKLPKSRQASAFRPLADQHGAVAIDESGGNDEKELGQGGIQTGMATGAAWLRPAMQRGPAAHPA